MSSTESIQTDAQVLESAYSKAMYRMVPLVFSCYLLFALARINIGFAKLDMLTALGMSEQVYGMAAGIFFIGYAFFGVPSNLILARVGARRWICILMLLWGLCSFALVYVSTPMEFYALRLLTGLVEAGGFPGILLYFTRWFPAERRGRVLSLFFVAIPLSGVAGGPISGFVLNLFQSAPLGIQAWQWIYIIQGIPALLCSFLIFHFLKDSVQGVSWLTDREKVLVQQEIHREEAQKAAPASSVQRVSPTAFLRSPVVWYFGICYFCLEMGEFAVSFWAPTIIKGFGFEDSRTIGLLSAIPFVFAGIVMVFAGKSADRRGERRWHLVIPLAAGVGGLVVAASCSHSPFLAMCGLTLAATGALTAIPMFWPLPTALLSTSVAAGGLALVNTIGNLAGFFGNALIGGVKDATGSTDIALFMVAGFVLVSALMILRIPASRVNTQPRPEV